MKRTIIYINPGPIYRPRIDSYQDEYKNLSKYFRGYLFTTSSVQEELSIGSFRYMSMKTDESILSSVRFMYFCIKNAIKLRIKGERVDLVDAYDPIKTGLYALMVSRILRAKCAVQVNGVYTSSAEWVDDADTLTTRIKKTIYPVIMGFVLKRVDGIKLLFDDQIEPFEKSVNGKIIRRFPCYVDTDVFYKESHDEENKEVLFVGFPFKRKGVDVLIHSFKSIANKYPDWKLKILGWFPDLSELHEAIDGHSQIYHEKPVHYNEMPKHIKSCAVLVLPSRSEAMGRALVEAMAAGKPRIGSNVDGIPTVINDGVDGLLVRPGDAHDLASKLDMLMGDPELRKEMGKKGKVRASKEFSKEIYNRNIVNFYTEVIDS